MWGRRLTVQGAVLTSQLSRERLREGEKSFGNCTKGSVLPWKASASGCSLIHGFALPAQWVRQSSGPGWAGFRPSRADLPPSCPCPKGSSPSPWPWLDKQAGQGGWECPSSLPARRDGEFYRSAFLSALIFSGTQDFQFTRSFEVEPWLTAVVWKAWLGVFPVGRAVPSPLVTKIHISLTSALSIFYFIFFKVCWTWGGFAKHEQSDELGSFPDKTLLSWKTSKLLSWLNNNFSRLGQPSGMERVGGCCKFTGNCTSYVLTLPLQQITRT